MTTIGKPKIDHRPEQLYVGIRTLMPFKGMSKVVTRISKELDQLKIKVQSVAAMLLIMPLTPGCFWPASNEPTPASNSNPAPGETATFSPFPGANLLGPYIIKQMESQEGETVAGDICNLSKLFAVMVRTTEVTYAFNFSPEGFDRGKWMYVYSIPSIGETHDASGTYSLDQPDQDGMRLLTMTGSDHVVSAGVGESQPVEYKLGLVPTEIANCP